MKKTILFFIFIFSAYCSFSEIVPIETARNIARIFYFERANLIKPLSIDAIKITQEFTEIDNSIPILYIFNIGLDNGYIIISAESNTIPVLAYSLEKNYYKDNCPPAFIWILNSYKNEIFYTRENNLTANEDISNMWEHYKKINTKTTSSIAQVPPLLGSIAWDQGCYYNALTPANNDAAYCNHNPTGCVATAMAMIMKYNAWPAQGVGSYTYNHTTANGFANNYGTLSANFGSSTYNWTSMPYNCTSANAEVAKIMYHCGIAVEMNYDANGSGAFVGVPPGYADPNAQKAFVNNFKYPTATYYQKSNFTDANWKTKIKTDIDASHPILYAGDDGSAGHAFVLDGYQGTNNDFYHFNFGWDGYANGYFYLTSITPNPGGTGGGSYNFSSNQEGVFSIIKSTSGVEEENENSLIEVFPNPSNGIFNLNINLNNLKDINTTVYNSFGLKVSENTLNTNSSQLDLSTLSTGVYFLTVKYNNQTFTKKITIIK